MEETIISVKNLTKFYHNNMALNDVSLDLYKGKVIGLLGPNGCGKTTFIKIIANLLSNYNGEVLIDGKKPGVYSKNIISYLPDRNYINENWTANYAIEYFSDFYSDFNKAKALKLFRMLKIDTNKRFKELSKGNKDKFQLILVLSRDAQIYLFDEPIAGVDPAAREMIFDLILNNYNKGATVLISTHLIYDVEKILDYAIFLKDGEVIRYDTVKEITKDGKTLEEVFKEDFRWLANY